MHCYIFSQFDLFAEIIKMQYNNLYFWAKQWQICHLMGICPLSILLGLYYGPRRSRMCSNFTDFKSFFEIIFCDFMKCSVYV